MNFAYNHQIFEDNVCKTVFLPRAQAAQTSQYECNQCWLQEIKEVTQNTIPINPQQPSSLAMAPIPLPHQIEKEPATTCNSQVPKRQDECLPQMTKDQRRVHDIIENHLVAILPGQNPKQLKMVIHGEGGTGKSALRYLLEGLIS